jgi:hypothetical protein
MASSTVQSKLGTVNDPFRWGRVVVGAIVLEAVITAVAISSGLLWAALGHPLGAIWVVIGNPVAFVLGCLVSAVAVRSLPSQQVLHGVMIGIVATVLFFGMTAATISTAAVVAQYGALNFYLGQVLRIAGCATGAFAVRGKAD